VSLLLFGFFLGFLSVAENGFFSLFSSSSLVLLDVLPADGVNYGWVWVGVGVDVK
jgi:hypothetical protein